MRLRPILFGEVLFDRFPDGQSVLGGAPFNVCWHLRGFGQDPLFVSRVGDDESGRLVRERMGEWRLDSSGLQTDPRRPTGEVVVALSEGGQPSFDIRAEQAYDYIDAERLLSACADAGPAILYRGTLAARSDHNAATLERLHQALNLPEFVDINLRTPWWSAARVEQTLRRARWAKLNDDELLALCSCDARPEALREAAVRARADWDLELLILTRGGDGATWIDSDRVIEAPAPRVDRIADTVGAGDAFASVALLGLLLGWPGETTLGRALQFAAEICTHRGATLADPSIYAQYLNAWDHDR